MQTKFINNPENITAELLEGYVLAYPKQVKLAAENIIVRAQPKRVMIKWPLSLWEVRGMNRH